MLDETLHLELVSPGAIVVQQQGRRTHHRNAETAFVVANGLYVRDFDRVELWEYGWDWKDVWVFDQYGELSAKHTQEDIKARFMQQTKSDPPPLSIRELCERAHAASTAAGWYDEYRELRADLSGTPRLGQRVLRLWIAERIALIHSEVSEALEAVREQEDLREVCETGDADNPKPEGFVVELADTFIRLGDLVAFVGLEKDIELQIQNKMAYNRTRGHRHGGKKL